MTGIEAIGAVGAATGNAPLALSPAISPANDGGASFASMLTAGMRHIEEKISTANELTRQFVLDDSIPVHQVTYALEEARLTVELAMQVRTRLVESYRELMNMQI